MPPGRGQTHRFAVRSEPGVPIPARHFRPRAITRSRQSCGRSGPQPVAPRLGGAVWPSKGAHLLQSAEAARRDGQPRWFVLTALIHDLGKILCLWGEPQWAVVGDTFPVGCAYSDKVVFPEFFVHNPDYQIPRYQTAAGVYEEGCGLDQVLMSWGHDEYMYHVVRDYLPPEALYMVR